MADDLGDEWWMETSDGNNSKDEINSEEEKVEDNENDRNIQPSEPNKKKSKTKKDEREKLKRKRKDVESTETDQPTEVKRAKEDEPESKDKEEQNEKKRKRKKKTKTEEIAEKPIVPLKPEDLINSLDKHYREKLSTVEMDEIEMKAEHFCECNDMEHTTVCSYMRSILPKWSKLLKEHDVKTTTKEKSTVTKGSPLVLILSSAALRATQLNRELESFKGDKCKTVKLFAKHFKIQEQIKYLSNNVVHLGVGTPTRIQALLENGALSLENTKRLVIDWSWRDVKLRRLVEIPEIKTQLFQLLKDFIIPRLKKGNCRIGLM